MPLSSWSALASAVLVAAAACAPRQLDPSGPAPPDGRLTESIARLSGPYARMVVATNGGAVIDTLEWTASTFDGAPGALVAAAATVSMPVCSVEPRTLAIAPAARAPEALEIDAALTDCDGFDFGYVLSILRGIKIPSTIIVIAANTAITVGSTNGGINYFYDDDIVRVLRAARTLYLPVCTVVPEVLELPTFPDGRIPGLTIEQALARCPSP